MARIGLEKPEPPEPASKLGICLSEQMLEILGRQGFARKFSEINEGPGRNKVKNDGRYSLFGIEEPNSLVSTSVKQKRKVGKSRAPSVPPLKGRQNKVFGVDPWQG